MSTPSPVALALPFMASSAAVARNQLQEWLLGLGQSVDVIEDSRLVLTELVGNAVRHAAPLADGTVRVSWTREPAGVDIAVTDGGGISVPHQVGESDSALGGRGLSIVEQLSNRWWLDRNDAETTVHAVVGLAHPSA